MSSTFAKKLKDSKKISSDLKLTSEKSGSKSSERI